MSTTCLLLLSAALLGQTEPPTTIPTAAELIAKTLVLDSADSKCRSLELVGRMKDTDEMDVKFRAVYRSTGESAFLLCDGTDDTPLMFVVGHQMLLYEPVGPVVYRSNLAMFEIRVDTRGDQSTLLFGLASGKKPGHIFFDLPSLLKTHSESEAVAPTGGTTYRLTRTLPEGAREVYHFDLSRPCPVTRIEMFDKEEKEPNGFFDLALNEVVKDDEFVFPDEKSLADVIAVKALPANNFLATAGGLFASMRACYVRMAAHHKAARDSLKFPGLVGIDWNRVEQNDAKYAQALRDLIPKAARLGLTPDAHHAEVFQIHTEDLFTPRFLKGTPGSPKP